jgi:transcriptional regulator with XRE-family HTH domain
LKGRIKEIRAHYKLTQKEFAEKIDLSQNYIAQVEIGKKELGERAIRDICRIYNVNEIWLRTGVGKMLSARSRKEEMSDLVSSLMAERPESFQAALVSTLLRFDPDGKEWAALESVYNSIRAEMKKSPED